MNESFEHSAAFSFFSYIFLLYLDVLNDVLHLCDLDVPHGVSLDPLGSLCVPRPRGPPGVALYLILGVVLNVAKNTVCSDTGTLDDDAVDAAGSPLDDVVDSVGADRAGVPDVLHDVVQVVQVFGSPENISRIL